MLTRLRLWFYQLVIDNAFNYFDKIPVSNPDLQAKYPYATLGNHIAGSLCRAANDLYDYRNGY